jgi:hypothetical protein
MSDTMKHILLAILAGIGALVLQTLTGIVPAAYQPIVTAAAAYFVHYYLENAPAGAPTLNPSAPANGPPILLQAPTPAVSTNSATPA